VSGPIPSDYCVNLSPRVAEACPKFLRWLGRGRYEFIGGLAEPHRGASVGHRSTELRRAESSPASAVRLPPAKQFRF
jgi:hypothetical protein